MEVDVAQVMGGLRNLSEKYEGDIYVETFIIEGLNDSDEHTEKMAKFLKNLKFTKLQINSLNRPGTEEWVKPATQEVLKRVKEKYEACGLRNVEIINEMKELEKR